MSDTNNGAKMNGQGNTAEGPVFTVHNIYVKDSSFEAPHSPFVFNQEWKPKLDFDLQMSSTVLSEPDHIYEVELHVTATMKLGEGKEEKPAFVIDLRQAGAFMIQGVPQDMLKQALSTTCPTVLFPYAREAISNMVARGGFPQLILPPINFDAMYAEHLARESGSAQSTKQVQETTVV